MYLTQKSNLKLTKKQFATLRLMCRLSKNLYNEALYNVRQHYFNEKKYLSYESNYHVCKNSENYGLLSTDIGQQTMKVVDRSFKSFFGLIKKAKGGSYQFNQIRLPHYLDKEGYFSLIIPRINIRNGVFAIPMSLGFKKEHGKIEIQIPERLQNKTIKEVRIHPKCKATFFEIEYIYEQENVKVELDNDKYLSIDLGLDNLATCVTTIGTSMIFDGKQIKSYNQWYNKEMARLQSITPKQRTRRMDIITRKRNNRINHGLSVIARRIINYCIDKKIGNIVCGYNIDFKRDINIGKVNNQNFVQIPHGLLRSKLEYLCELYGIKYHEQEESYTSKSSFFDNDILPIFNTDNPQTYQFKGKRISRGQYKTANNMIINADVNGALNILKKSKLIDLTVLQNRGCLNQPQRVKVF